jgi:hypothetical protein
MHNKKGFSLISFLLYLTLFSMIMLFSCHIIVSLIIPSFASVRNTQSIIAMHVATDLFVRDIHNIDEGVVWKHTAPAEIMWHTGDHDICWRLQDKCLERVEGTYNNGWKDKTVSIVASGISKIDFTYKKDGQDMRAIELSLTPVAVHYEPIFCYVAVKSRKNHEK